MKKLLMVIPLVFLLCFTSGCKQQTGQLHPEMKSFIDTMSAFTSEIGFNDLPNLDVKEARSILNSTKTPEEVLPPVIRIENLTIPGPDGEIPIRIYRPSDVDHLPVLMWFHGGGWVLGSLDGAELNCRKFASEAKCVVVSVDYRLAPETPFPGAIDDCYAATTWVVESAKELNIDSTRIAVGGDSAGGNLAACVAYRSRDMGPKLVFQLLVYPVIDADFTRTSYIDNGENYFLTREWMEWFWDCYVPNKADRKNPFVAPIHALDLSGLPTAHIITAEFDPLRDEGEAYGEALKSAGVEAEIHRYNGMIHAFFNMLTSEPVDEVLEATRTATEALKSAFIK
ncbi:alpha/beta hydrolase [Acidobacteriota bacterium]